MPFKPQLLVAAGVPASVGLFVYERMFGGKMDSTVFPQLAKQCRLPRFEPKLLWRTACKLDGVFVPLCSDNVGRAAFVLVCLMVAPTTIWISLQGGKSGRSVLLGPWLPATVVSLGQLFGVGVMSPLVFPSVYALVKCLEPKNIGLPAPPTKTFVTASLTFSLTILATVLALAFTPVSSPHWLSLNWLFQFSPLVLYALCLFPTSRPIKEETPKATRLFEYLQPLLVVAYYAALALLAHGIWIEKAPPTFASEIILWDTLGATTAFIGIWLVDLANDDAKATPALKILLQAVLLGPPAAMCTYYAHKEAQSAKRADVLKKTK